ncbi:MAG: hypothetical protein IKS45_09395, partial [Thermoguttaceae bacterium]|nr:hypothetical protein [Thermoguttaceae bacterium]
IWLINDLNKQFQFLQQVPGNISPGTLNRLSSKLNEIELQLRQYEYRGEKPKTKINSDALIPRPEKVHRPNMTAMETGAIRLAMQNILRLREAINEKQKYNSAPTAFNYFSYSVNDSESLEFLSSSTTPLIGTSEPGTTFVMTYSLPQSAAARVSIWQILSLLFIPFVIWLAFFPPESFIMWRPPFVLGCLSVIWLLCFNLYGVSILLFFAAVVDVLNKLRQHSKSNVVPLVAR